jgi:hypothetical protein
MPRLPALAVLLLLAHPAAADEEPPPALVEATEKAAALCQAAGGTPRILPDYEVTRDLNGDGRPDFVTDLARLECAGAWDALCIGRGCPVSAWLSEPGGSHDRFDLGPLRGFHLTEGEEPPALVASYDAADCGLEATEGCTRTWRFTSNAPETPPVDAPPEATAAAEPTAAAAPEPPPIEGWTLRRVPGASPVALGGGPGDIASLAAFCLEDQPFLAVTFHDRPQTDAVALDFAFSQGALDVTAGYESTAGGAYVVALAGSPLASRLAGRDSEVALEVDGRPEGILSLSGSTKSLRGALADCYAF